MKRFFIISCFLLSACLSSFVLADGSVASGPAMTAPPIPSAAMTAPPRGNVMAPPEDPCNKIIVACQAAGYTAQDLVESCLKPIMTTGKSNEYVSISDNDAAACKTAHAPRPDLRPVSTQGPGQAQVPGQTQAPGQTQVPGQAQAPGQTQVPGQAQVPAQAPVQTPLQVQGTQ